MDKSPLSNREKLEREIGRLIGKMSRTDPSSDEYEQMVKRLQELMKLVEPKAPLKEEKKKGEPWIKGETVLTCLTNLAGIGMILKHEELNVIATKALGFVLRGRV